MKKILIPFLSLLFAFASISNGIAQKWEVNKAWQWYEKVGWRAGCNFIPSTAINQLEMWQEDTYDPQTIDRELSWAADLGFSLIRVYLHYLPWQENPEAFKKRLTHFLEICQKHQLLVMFVLFDDCWYGNAQPGPQPSPTPGLHNSYWLQCPRYSEINNQDKYPVFEKYVKDLLTFFSSNQTVAIWDMYNEPGNNHHPKEILPFVQKVMEWGREAAPTQPLTLGVWQWRPDFVEINNYSLENSDVVSFHNYGNFESMKKDIDRYLSYDRPVICTEYLAREYGSKFQTHLPYMKEKGVGAINWGLVFGKTQTVYPWNSPLNAPIPEIWHHDIFYPDGKPFDPEEESLIRQLTGKL